MENFTIESAKQFLKDNGYYTENLWHTNDVTINYVCDAQEAYNILDEVLNSDRIKSEINETIDLEASFADLQEHPKYFLISGFWKDDKVKFKDRLATNISDESVSEKLDGMIFFYELNEYEIQKAIALGIDNDFDFVITSYSPTTLE
jgi:hypothetical protein